MSLILLIAAVVLFILQAVGVSLGRVHAGWAGLACWALASLV